MIPLLGNTAVAIGNSLVLSLIVKATIVSALALTAARVSARARASVRHLLLASGFVVLLALPVVTLTLPAFDMSVPIAGSVYSMSIAPAGPLTPDVTWQIVRRYAQRRAASAARSRTQPSMAIVLLIIWLAGAAIVLARMIADMLRVRQIRWHARRWSRAESIAADIQLLLNDAVGGPLVCGVFRPAIVLPCEACQWHPDDLRRAVIHEAEHVRRADVLIFCVARIACALYWFHPLVWRSWSQLRLEAERACDDAVIAEVEPVAYASQLVMLAERLVLSRIESAPAMAHRTDLACRVSALLNPRQRRGPAGLPLVASVSMLAGLLIAAVSPLRAVPLAQDAAQARFEVASIKRTTKAPVECVQSSTTSPGRLNLCGALSYYIQDSYDLYTKGRGFSPGVMRAAWTANIQGAPAWLNSELYQIEAKAAGNAPLIVMMGPMLQAFFEDRLRLRTHLETRNVPVYELTATKGGAKLGRSDTDCAPFDPMKPPAEPVAPGQVPPRTCGGFKLGKGTMDFTEFTLSDFAQYLGRNIVRRPVIDKVGMTGRFDFHLEFTPDENTPLLHPSGDETGPSVFTAIQEQLGLKLEPATGPREFLIIDSVERPSEN